LKFVVGVLQISNDDELRSSYGSLPMRALDMALRVEEVEGDDWDDEEDDEVVEASSSTTFLLNEGVVMGVVPTRGSELWGSELWGSELWGSEPLHSMAQLGILSDLLMSMG
jgi:hypothetical protein